MHFLSYNRQTPLNCLSICQRYIQKIYAGKSWNSTERVVINRIPARRSISPAQHWMTGFCLNSRQDSWLSLNLSMWADLQPLRICLLSKYLLKIQSSHRQKTWFHSLKTSSDMQFPMMSYWQRFINWDGRIKKEFPLQTGLQNKQNRISVDSSSVGTGIWQGKYSVYR